MEEYWHVADTPEQCRERRLRRIKMRRSRWCCCGHHFHRQFSSYRINQEDRTSSTGDHEMMPPQDNKEQMNPMPDLGMLSLIRRHSESTSLFAMEDFCRLELLGGQPMHFFAVFDVHGDPYVSTLCKQLMHQFVAEELRRRVCDTPGASEATAGGNWSSAMEEGEGDEDKWRDVVQTAIERSFQRMNRLSGQQSCRCGSVTDECRCEVTILTAVMAILTAQHIVIANSGTSRAVLGRAGRSLSLPHHGQPESSLDSQERLCAVDGRDRVFHHNCMRVYGILNMSQSHAHTGDGHLVNIFMTERDANEDECLILANDGIQNTISDDVASRVASTCLRFDQGEAARAPVNIDGCVYDTDTARDDKGAGMFFSSKSNSTLPPRFGPRESRRHKCHACRFT